MQSIIFREFQNLFLKLDFLPKENDCQFIVTVPDLELPHYFPSEKLCIENEFGFQSIGFNTYAEIMYHFYFCLYLFLKEKHDTSVQELKEQQH